MEPPVGAHTNLIKISEKVKNSNRYDFSARNPA